MGESDHGRLDTTGRRVQENAARVARYQMRRAEVSVWFGGYAHLNALLRYRSC